MLASRVLTLTHFCHSNCFGSVLVQYRIFEVVSSLTDKKIITCILS